MDEMVNNEVVEEVEAVDEGSGSDISDAELDAMWDNDDDNDEMFAEEFSEEADQPIQETEITEETEPTEAEQPDGHDTDQYLELKHFDEVKKVSREEAKVLAQKGMDYDRIRGKLDEATNSNAELKMYKDFLDEIKGDFASIEDLMTDTRAKILADKDNISYEDAVSKVKAAYQQQKQEAQNQGNQMSRDAMIQEIRKESFASFAKEHPDIKPSDIPKEVWDDLAVTNNLPASWARYEAKKLAQENEALKNNAKNKARSTGSMKSSGKQAYDEIDRMWYEDDY